jgi:hypothetical protein
LDIGVLVAYAPFEGAHGFFRLHCLGADYVRDFEVERDILAIESISMRSVLLPDVVQAKHTGLRLSLSRSGHLARCLTN